MTGRTPPPAGQADAALDRLLDRVPAPPMPEGLAARIVRDVTRLPQVAPDSAGTPVHREPEKIVAIGAAPDRRRRFAWAGGGLATALAASLAALAVLPETVRQEAAPVARDPAPAPASAPATVAAHVPAAQAPEARLAEEAPVRQAPRKLAAVPAPATPARPEREEEAPPKPPAAIALPVLEMADMAAGNASPSPSVAADDDTALAGNGGTPLPKGQAPAPQGWGYAPGTGYPATPAIRADDGSAGRTAPDRQRPGRRF
ncbi:MAG: hypothetical protein QM690_08805 [Sphingobium sp.]